MRVAHPSSACARLDVTEFDEESISISYCDLFVPAGDGARESLHELDADEHSHIHGTLRLVVGGRTLPHMGFFGPDDVCFNDWIPSLEAASTALSTDQSEVFVLDDCEQGQPAFEFRRLHDKVLVSIIAGVGGGDSDPAWQRVPCDLERFQLAVSNVVHGLRAEISSAAGTDAWQAWWKEAARSVPRSLGQTQPDLPRITIDLVFLSLAEGGRKKPPIVEQPRGYRPHLVLQDRGTRLPRLKDGNTIDEPYLGVAFLTGPRSVQAGDTARYTAELCYHPHVSYADVRPGAELTLREGARIVGHGVVVARTDL